MNIILRSLFVLLMGLYGTVYADQRIAILSFELNDITSLPNTPAEIIRTASIKPLLEQELKKIGNYDLIQISMDQQKAENAGFGYLFKFDDVAAKLGKQFGADWVIVGQHSKPSFLFSYLMAHLIHVKTGKKVARFDIEMKGNHQKVTKRGVKKLSKKVNRMIAQSSKSLGQ